MAIGYMAYRLATNPSDSELRRANTGSKVTVKRGDEILEGPYPKSFEEFVGQDKARLQIIAAITSAIHRNARLDHVLLASGHPGIGKTTLGRLAAHLRGVGFVELGGKVNDRDAASAVSAMEDGDILFLDEIHRMVSGGKASAEWLLTLLQDGVLHTPQGVVVAPDITIIAATTDAQKLPETILDRFTVKPLLETYTSAEALQIARVTAKRLGYGGTEPELPMPTEDDWLKGVCKASLNNPRRIGQLLKVIRDIALSTELGNLADDRSNYDISMALDWSGLTEDGLTQGMQDYLVALYIYGGRAGISTLKAALNETEVGHTEKHLIQMGLVVVTASGRELTDYGTERAEKLAQEQMRHAHARENKSNEQLAQSA